MAIYHFDRDFGSNTCLSLFNCRLHFLPERFVLYVLKVYPFFKDFRLEIEKLDDAVEYNLVSAPQTPNWPQCEKDDVKCQEMQNSRASGEEDEEGDDKVATCDTLRMCIITTLNWGLRNGGGIGDVLRNVDPSEPYFLWQVLFWVF